MARSSAGGTTTGSGAELTPFKYLHLFKPELYAPVTYRHPQFDHGYRWAEMACLAAADQLATSGCRRY